MAAGDEWLIGNPDVSRDTAWDFIQGPTWGELLDRIEEEDLERCDLVIIGAIYCNSDEIGGVTLHVEDTEQLYRVTKGTDLDIDDPEDTAAIVQRYLDLECEPKAILGFVVREI
jgi:hypothetical protein